MAKEIQESGLTIGGVDYYARVWNAAGQIWRPGTAVYEAYNAVNIALYGADAGSGTPYQDGTEDGSTGRFTFDSAATSPRYYEIVEQAGAAPLESDQIVAAGVFVATASVLGTPAGASIAADIAALETAHFGLLQSTTIATLASQTSFTLTAGSADNDTYNGSMAVITDSATSTQKAVAWISDYTGATKTVTLNADPAVFTMAVGDSIDIIAVPKQLDAAISTAHTVTVSAAAPALTAISSGGTITIHRGDKTTILITDLGSLAGRTGEKLFFTIKANTQDSDANAILQLTETTGLLVLNKAVATTPGDGSLTVDDATDGDITIVLKNGATQPLPLGTSYSWDIQIIDSAGQPRTLTRGKAVVEVDVTQRITAP